MGLGRAPSESFRQARDGQDLRGRQYRGTGTRDPRGLGRLGEDIAAAYLAGKGLRIVARNVLVEGGEIDLIVLDRADQVAVEVRTVTSGTVLRQFDHRKVAHVRQLSTKTIPPSSRLDLVGVELGREQIGVWWLRRVE